MKKIPAIFCFVLAAFSGSAQSIDSLLSTPATLELNITTPQPRLQEKFQIILENNYIVAHIFKPALGKIEVVEDIGNNDGRFIILNVNALIKGKNVIGPLQFNLNGTQYSTNKIEFEVIDPLPQTDEGLWIRKVTTGDSTFCIIMEQRIPAKAKVKEISPTETKFYTEPVTDNLARFKFSYSIDGLDGNNSSRYSDFGRIIDKNGAEKKFLFGYSITYFRITDKKKKIIITKDKFDNIPKDYKFESIVIQ